MNNIILTGERGIGKSTLADKIIKTADLKAAGLKTLFKEARNESHSFLYACPYGTEPVFDENHIIARFGNGFPQALTDRFDALCAGFINAAVEDTNTDLIVIDELGFLEKDALIFKEAVLKALGCSKPVIAVIRQGLPGWTSEAANMGELFEVSQKNRDQLPDVILRKFNTLTAPIISP